MSGAGPAHMFADREYLRGSQYASSQNLAARQSIYRYLDPPADFYAWALDHVEWSGEERVLDVGCGNGMYLQRLRRERAVSDLVGLDLSDGMVREVADGWEHGPSPVLMVGDATYLPFADSSFDVVLAMHMLYHVPDIDACIHELRRVARPGGVVLVATNHPTHLDELNTLYRDAAAPTGAQRAEIEATLGSRLRFKLNDEARDRLEEAFVRVEIRALPSTLRIPEVEAIVDYLESTRALRERFLPTGKAWDGVMGRIRDIVSDVIARDGTFDVRPHAGVFVCHVEA